MSRDKRLALLEKIEAARGSRVICLLTSDRQNLNAQLAKDVLPYFNEHLRDIGKTERVDVFICTQGGDTLAGFGLSRLVRENASFVGALIAEKCYRAGTLFAVGANEIVMTPGPTLSPFDPSLVGPLNPAVELAPVVRCM